MIEKYVSREELRRLLAGLLVVFGGILLFVLFALLVVPGLRNANRPATQTPASSDQGESGWLDPTEYPAVRGHEIPPLDPQAVILPTEALAARGRTLYSQYCSTCHGDSGRGDGPGSGGLRPSPRDFTRTSGWKNGPGLAQIYKTLRAGLAPSAMTSYDFLSRMDRMALVHFVRSLASFPLPSEDAVALLALQQDLAAQGERVANRIPVSLAQQKLIDEFETPPPLMVEPAVSALMRDAVADGVRAARVLAAMPAWRQGPEALARFAVAGIPVNGFRVAVAAFGSEDWRRLFDDLMRATAPGREAPALSPPGGKP